MLWGLQGSFHPQGNIMWTHFANLASVQPTCLVLVLAAATETSETLCFGAVKKGSVARVAFAGVEVRFFDTGFSGYVGFLTCDVMLK
jgi:hypothetical protein